MSRRPNQAIQQSVARMLSPRGVIAVGLVLWIGMVLLCCWVSYQAYHDAVRLATESSRNLLLVLQRDIERTVHSYDLSLEAVIEGARNPEIMALPPRLRNRVLFDHSATAPYLGAMVLLNASGRVIADSSAMDAFPDADFSDRQPFQVHRLNPALDFWMSPPHISKRRPDMTEVTISRRVLNASGEFIGVVIGTINIDYFRYLLEGLDLRSSGTAAIIMTDGTMLARLPYDRAIVGKNFRSGAIFRQLISQPSGVEWGTASLDGVKRLNVFKRLPNLSLVIDIAPSEQDIFDTWRSRSIVVGMLALLFSAIVLPGMLLFARELRQRRDSEIELRREAHLDPLTGLENRGTFDRAIQKACAISSRTGAPLSLVFLDLDKFKAYNDTYGHQAGDKVLQETTHAARRKLRRITDHFARYGGEEFVAILEGVGAEEARLAAEEIRSAISDLGIAHSGNASGVVTASIGVATSHGAVSPDEIIHMADEALYDAKATGRNKVAVFSCATKAIAPGPKERSSGL